MIKLILTKKLLIILSALVVSCTQNGFNSKQLVCARGLSGALYQGLAPALYHGEIVDEEQVLEKIRQEYEGDLSNQLTLLKFFRVNEMPVIEGDSNLGLLYVIYCQFVGGDELYVFVYYDGSFKIR